MALTGTGDGRMTWLLRWPVIVAIVLVLIGLIGFAAPYTFANSTTKDDERQEVISRAKDFASTMNTFDAADLEDYQKRMSSLVTKKYKKEFSKATETLFPQLEKAELSSGDPKLLGAAVKSMGSNSAKVMIAIDAKTEAKDEDTEKASTTRHFRWELTLKKNSDDWLVDDLQDIATMDAELEKSGEGADEDSQEDQTE